MSEPQKQLTLEGFLSQQATSAALNGKKDPVSGVDRQPAPISLDEVEAKLGRHSSVDRIEVSVQRSPLDAASFPSRMLFCWMNQVMEIGAKKTLEEEDLSWILPKADYTANLYAPLRREWSAEKAKPTALLHCSKPTTKPSLLRAIVRAYGGKFSRFAFMGAAEAAVELTAAVLLGSFVEALGKEGAANRTDVWAYGTAILLLTASKSLLHAKFFFHAWRFGMQLRIATMAAIFDKVLVLQLASLHKVTVGYVTNLASNDIERFQKVGMYTHYLWLGPAVAVAVLLLLWREIGPSALAGCALIALLIPVQSNFSRKFARLRKQTATVTDERVKLTAQVIQGAALVKMSAWEPSFQAIIGRTR